MQHPHDIGAGVHTCDNWGVKFVDGRVRSGIITGRSRSIRGSGTGSKWTADSASTVGRRPTAVPVGVIGSPVVVIIVVISLPIAQIPCAVIALVLCQTKIDTACDVASVLVTCPYATLLLTSTLSRRRCGTKVDLGLPMNVCRKGARMAIEAWLFHFESMFGDAITVGLLSSLLAIGVAGARGT